MGGPFEPAHTLGIGLLAAYGVGDARHDVRTGVFRSGAQSGTFTFRGNSSTGGAALVCHADFGAVLRATQG